MLLPKCEKSKTKEDNKEGLVFLYKMQGDYQRYIAEYAQGKQKEHAA